MAGPSLEAVGVSGIISIGGGTRGARGHGSQIF